MQKQFQRLMSAVALAASVHLWAMPQVSALAPAQEEEPALYYDTYGAAFYLTPEEADTLLPDLDAEPVILEVPEEDPTPTQDEDTRTASAEEDTVATMPDPDSDHAFDKTDAGFNVTPEKPEEEQPKQTSAVDVYSEPETISVTVTWGDMNFEYVSGEWDTEKLCYNAPSGTKSAGWQPIGDNSNKIIFTNNGTAAVNVVCKYERESLSEYTSEVEFKDDTQTQLFTDVFNPVVQLAPEITSADDIALYDYDKGVTVNGTLSVEVTLTGPRPAETMDSQKIGTITATISAVKQASGTSDITS